MFSQQFEELKREVQTFYEIMRDPNKTFSQVENAKKGVVILMLEFDRDGEQSVMKQHEAHQVDMMLHMVARDFLRYSMANQPSYL